MCGYAIDTPYERTLWYQILDPQFWYSNVNGGPTSWTSGLIIQVNGWLNLDYYVLWEGTYRRFFKKISFWSQCDSSTIVFQVQEEKLLDNQEIQGTIFCERSFPEETVSKTPGLIFYIGPVGHSEFDVYFALYCRFA